MTNVGEPTIADRPEQLDRGICTPVPMKGLCNVVAHLRKEVSAWFKQRGVDVAGPPFLR